MVNTTEIDNLIIDCDSNPFCPDGWKVKQHIKNGQVKWNPNEFKFHLSLNQLDSKTIQGYDLLRELEKKPVLNTNVLFYHLLKKPHLIPEEWGKDEQGETLCIPFWGTIYENSVGDLYVCYLYRKGDIWDWHYKWLGFFFGSDSPALISAKNLRDLEI